MFPRNDDVPDIFGSIANHLYAATAQWCIGETHPVMFARLADGVVCNCNNKANGMVGSA